MLHELGCKGPTPATGCLCPPRGALDAYVGSVALAELSTWSNVDGYISNLESLLMALEQRPLDKHQNARLRLILNRAYRRIR